MSGEKTMGGGDVRRPASAEELLECGIGPRMAPAWHRLLEIVDDGGVHAKADLVARMGEAAPDLAPKTIDAILYRAAKAGLVEKSSASSRRSAWYHLPGVPVEPPVETPPPREVPIMLGDAEDLLDKLRRWRREVAGEQGVPAYVVFHDRTLVEIVTNSPRNLTELGEVTGVGPIKLERYGEAVLGLLGADPVEAATAAPAPSTARPQVALDISSRAEAPRASCGASSGWAVDARARRG